MRTLTEKQQKFLDALALHGDIDLAIETAEYASNSKWNVVQSLRKEIADIASGVLASSSVSAALKLKDIITSSSPVPQAAAKIQACNSVLDRTGHSKVEKLEVNAEGGLFILPAKDA